MERKVIDKSEFITTMMIGYGAKTDKLLQVKKELDILGISFEKFINFIKKNYLSGELESWQYINLPVCLNNYILNKVDKIMVKSCPSNLSNPLFLHYNRIKDITEFCDVKKVIKFFQKHDCFKNKFIRRLNDWLLK